MTSHVHLHHAIPFHKCSHNPPRRNIYEHIPGQQLVDPICYKKHAFALLAASNVNRSTAEDHGTKKHAQLLACVDRITKCKSYTHADCTDSQTGAEATIFSCHFSVLGRDSYLTDFLYEEVARDIYDGGGYDDHCTITEVTLLCNESPTRTVPNVIISAGNDTTNPVVPSATVLEKLMAQLDIIDTEPAEFLACILAVALSTKFEDKAAGEWHRENALSHLRRLQSPVMMQAMQIITGYFILNAVETVKVPGSEKQVLRLSFTDIHIDNVPCIGGALDRADRAVTEITVQSYSRTRVSPVGDALMAEIAGWAGRPSQQVMGAPNMLRRLCLASTGITDAGLVCLSESTACLPHITDLNLSHNHIGDVGFVALAKKLPELRCIQNLRCAASLILSSLLFASSADC